MRQQSLLKRRWINFKKNKRGLWSLRIFLVIFVLCMGADFVANDRPILVYYDQGLYVPALKHYPETTFGGQFLTDTNYRDPYVEKLINDKGFMVWPLIRFRYDTFNYNLKGPAPTPPDLTNLLGTDDQGRDVLARLIYGLRLSLLFGITLTVLSSIIGIIAGAIQGYYGGVVDLAFQRFMEVWSGLPVLFIILIIAGIVTPGFWMLLGIMLLFSWMSLVGLVRAEFLRVRNFDFVKAARALGVNDLTIMWRHILPNAVVASLTFLPFILNGSLVALTSLDFIGFGLPPGSPSLGELLSQGKDNLTAPWLGITSFISLAVLLSLLIFIGEAVRDAFDPRKLWRTK